MKITSTIIATIFCIFSLGVFAEETTFNEAIANCEYLQSQDHVRANCWLKEYRGDPHLMFVFGDKKDMEQYINALEKNIAGPFCDKATVKVGLISVLLIEDKISFSECKNEWSEWESLTEFKNQ